MHDYWQVQTTTSSREEAAQIATALVEQQLAACVQIVGPITSTYRWEGQVTVSEEWLCVAKTRAALYARVEEAICALHSYEVPEVIATPIVTGSRAYLAWVDCNTLPPEPSSD